MKKLAVAAAGTVVLALGVTAAVTTTHAPSTRNASAAQTLPNVDTTNPILALRYVGTRTLVGCTQTARSATLKVEKGLRIVNGGSAAMKVTSPDHIPVPSWALKHGEYMIISGHAPEVIHIVATRYSVCKVGTKDTLLVTVK